MCKFNLNEIFLEFLLSANAHKVTRLSFVLLGEWDKFFAKVSGILRVPENAVITQSLW